MVQCVVDDRVGGAERRSGSLSEKVFQIQETHSVNTSVTVCVAARDLSTPSQQQQRTSTTITTTRDRNTMCTTMFKFVKSHIITQIFLSQASVRIESGFFEMFFLCVFIVVVVVRDER